MKNTKKKEKPMTTKEEYQAQTDALNQIADIVSATPGITYHITECISEECIPEGIEIEYGTDEALEISVFRENDDLY